MVMKDKLYKSGHKGAYYNTKKFCVILACVLFGGTAVTVPTYISFAKQRAALAETQEEVVLNEEENELQNEEENDGIDPETILEYCE